MSNRIIAECNPMRVYHDARSRIRVFGFLIQDTSRVEQRCQSDIPSRPIRQRKILTLALTGCHCICLAGNTSTYRSHSSTHFYSQRRLRAELTTVSPQRWMYRNVPEESVNWTKVPSMFDIDNANDNAVQVYARKEVPRIPIKKRHAE